MYLIKICDILYFSFNYVYTKRPIIDSGDGLPPIRCPLFGSVACTYVN